MLNIYFQKCQNSTLQNKSNCLPDEIIEKKLSHAHLITFSIDNDITFKNNIKPFQPFLKSEDLPISTSMYKTYIKEMSEIRLNSDNSLLFPYVEEYKSYKFSRMFQKIDLKDEEYKFPGTFSQMNIYANSNTKIYNRSYKKLFEVIFQIGGFSNGIIYATYIFLYFYSRNIILWNCIFSSISAKEIKKHFSDDINSLKIKEKKIKILEEKKEERDQRELNQNNQNSVIPNSQNNIMMRSFNNNNNNLLRYF